MQNLKLIDMIEFKGECKGVRLVSRGKKDSHISIEILAKDDGNWFECGTPFSSYWVNELIQKLQEAKQFIETQEPDIYEGKQYGYKFKEYGKYITKS